MDKQYIKDNKLVERYLRQELTDEERQAFRVALLFDEGLQQEVEETRFLFQNLQRLKVPNEETKTAKPKPWFGWLMGALAVVAFVGFVYLINRSGDETKAKPSMEIPVESSKRETPIQAAPTQEVETAPEEEPTVQPAEPQEKSEKTSPRPKAPQSPQPIAKADTSVHPYLDQFTRGSLRSNESSLSIRSPKIGETLPSENEKIKLSVQGILSIDEAPERERFIIRLFSNKEADFYDFKPIFSIRPSFRKSGNDYEMSSDTLVSLAAGLYYFTVEDKETEDMIYVGKVRVK